MDFEVYLGFGSNLGDRLKNIAAAFSNLHKRGVHWNAVSSVYSSKPYGVVNQPDFLNCVGRFIYAESPQRLLKTIGEIELFMGRVRKERWGPRNIDIDILLFGDLVMEEEYLTIPHRDIINRAFVLLPLVEIDSELADPRNGEFFSTYLKRLNLIDWPEPFLDADVFAELLNLEVE